MVFGDESEAKSFSLGSEFGFLPFLVSELIDGKPGIIELLRVVDQMEADARKFMCCGCDRFWSVETSEARSVLVKTDNVSHANPGALYFLPRYQLNVYTEHGQFMIVPWIKSEYEAQHDESAFGK